MRKAIIFSVVGILVLAGLVIAQAGSATFPQTFTFNLNPLPPSQSPTQLFFNCPYGDGSIVLRDVKIFNNPTGLNPDVNAQVRFWMNNGKCSASFSKNFSVAPALSSSQLVTNFNTAVNAVFQQEALSNHQPTQEPSPVSSSSNGNTSPNSTSGGVGV